MVGATMVFGALIGGAVGAFFGDPFRNQMGQYTTRGTGFFQWGIQTVLGAVFGGVLTTAVVALIAANPLITTLLVMILLYAVYRSKIDPR